MDNNKLAELFEQRRNALVSFAIGQVRKNLPGDADDRFNFVRTPGDLFELLRLDPLDRYQVQNTRVAEAISCAQNFIHAAYRKLEPGYATHEFDKQHLKLWELYGNYGDWQALQIIGAYPENFITPFVRQRKTSLFKTLENNLNQTRLSMDSVLSALRDYLHEFEQICCLDVISCFMDGPTPANADYYFVGRQLVAPFQYYWRKAEVELTSQSRTINPAAWSEWQPVDIPVGARVLDMRSVFWNGRLCLVWAEWQDKVEGTEGAFLPYKLDVFLAFKGQNDQWSAPLSLFHDEPYDDVSDGCRLIATVWVDQQYTKGRLGVLLTNRLPEENEDNEYSAYMVHDVLLRPVANDDGRWLDILADNRFVSSEVVQHPVQLESLTINESVEVAGSLTEFYSLQALALTVGTQDVLFVRGVCAKTTVTDGGESTFDLKLLDGTGDDPAPVEDNFPGAGQWATAWIAVKRDRGGFTGRLTFTFGENNTEMSYGRKKFEVTVGEVKDFLPPALDKTDPAGAQFLKFLSLPGINKGFISVRLNSLFGPELVQRANVSVDAVMDWSTQHLPEPVLIGVQEPNGAFDGANGLFFWELFFHVPHLVAARLSEENRFQEAQQWLHYLFDPQAPAKRLPEDPDYVPDRPLYWRCRPLMSAGNPGHEVLYPTDPDAIGYGAPRHFRIVAFIDYVKNLVAWGDWYYRQLTRDSLVAAKLCYVQAEFLMGKPPSARTVSRWAPASVADLMDRTLSRPALERFERELDLPLGEVPAAAESIPPLGLLAVDGFAQPINDQLLKMYDLPAQRLFNLRHNLTLDGRPMEVPFFSPMTDPNQLLRDLAAGGSGTQRPMGGQQQVVAFRWRVMYEAALRAVQTLQEYGGQVLRLLEQRDRAEMEEDQQRYLVEAGDYAKSTQEQTIAQLEASAVALTQSRALAQERANAYALRFDENVSAVEYDVMDQLLSSKQMGLASKAIKGGGAVIASLPNIFGLSNGGHRGDKLADAIVYGLELASMALQIDADKNATTEGYRRRRNEWALQRDQALAEVRVLDEQITAQGHAVDAARTTLSQTLHANAQALKLYNFLKKRSTRAELFNWLLGQLKALHYQAYDAVVGLCLSTQASMSAETGDYDAQIALPQVWQEERHGLTAGEHLRVYLLRMEREYLHRHTRRLELVKTVSLRQLFDKGEQPGQPDWEAALGELKTTGSLEFRLTQLLFDRDHPGHYCRQISSIEVDLPVLVGPYENVKATLTQVSSMTATKATTLSVEYLHSTASNAVPPPDVRFNLLSGQMMALSMGVNDTGMTSAKPDEGLLFPFECTGAISSWRLTFPWADRDPQESMLRSLTDIVLRVRYTARVGDPTFARKVEELVRGGDPDDAGRQTAPVSPKAIRSEQGADNHE
ncbi:hypothetical protein PMI36_01643 [Pseudomonas sp. GM79]|uniref:Tc toxin subunit A-related protein n=1 Tax=Pseudomonas sp. GM79 TaxID=1144338 RepID=UPI00026F8D6E|nr:neuraminidase-like domain-containing protein [Pseudomonas sp. GM79]EJN25746.1 hypothetical protein PMI36_01643 [Pseudomonas sp. GM79]